MGELIRSSPILLALHSRRARRHFEFVRAYLDHLYAAFAGRGVYPFYETRLRRRNTFRYLAEFERSQWLPPDRLRSLQWSRLQQLLRHAWETSPYYREVFDRLRIRPEDIRNPGDFAMLPVLEKADIRAHRQRMISSRFSPSQLYRSASGGSTGEPVQYYYNRDSYERRMAAAMRGDRWAGWRLCAPELYIWGTNLLPQEPLRRLKTKLHFAALRRAALSSFELSESTIRRAVEYCNRARPRAIIGYANAVYEFARSVEATGLEVHRPEGIILSAERVFPYQKETIARVLRAPVFERYGCREVMMIGAECEHHAGMHVTADNLYVEIERNGRPCEPGEPGEVLLTDLHNYGMPLIRYRVGDVAVWSGHDCPCGRGLPLLKSVEGRTLDMLSTPDGRVVSGVFFPHLLKDFPLVRSFEVVQEARDRVVIRLALDGTTLPEEDRRFLEETVSRTLGPEMRVEWIAGPEVRIERQAKFRPVRSEVSVEWDAAGAAR